MEYRDAQDLVGRRVENPAATIALEDLVVALCTLVVRNGLLGFVAPPPDDGSD